MTEVGPADLSRPLQSRRHECSAIVTSRKRKLRELFAVASHADALPNDGFANPDAPASTPTEWQFLQASDILQGKTLNELNIPARPRPSLDKLKRSAAAYASALSAHAPPAPPPRTLDNDSVTAQNEALASHVSPAKGGGSPPPVARPPASMSSAKATPIVRPPQPASRGPPPSPVQPVKASAVLAALPEPRAGDSSLGKAQKLNGDVKVNGQAKEGGVSKRLAQVKFPPGTKASSSPDEANDVPASLETGGPTTNGADGKADSASTDARAEGSGPPTIKLPADTTKIPEALSTPGSTAPSAATPAAHDASTDTSPDNDGRRYVDVVDSNEDKSQGSAVDAQDQGSSAEDQLLQESIQSSVAATDRSEAPAAAPGLVFDASSAAATAKLAATEHGSTPAQASSEVQPSHAPAFAVQPPAGPAPAEVSDSQDEGADEMDVDGPEIKPETENSKVLASRELNLPAQVAPARSPAEKPPPPKEQPQAPQVPERAVTRVSSGAMRLKSVNEIVGGFPRPSNCTNRDAVTKGTHDQLTPVTSTPQSPASRVRNPAASKRERGKGPASKVLFGKQPKRVEDKTLVPSHKEMIQASDDYYTPLFVHNFIGSSNWMQPLDRILYQANKTISTPDAHLVIQDHQACRVLRRVYHLQQHDKWSLRQPRRGPEAVRPPSQWDTLLREMKWMRTDFREERKWKMTVARNLAHACAEWHEAGPEERKHLQVAAAIPPKAQPTERDVLMVDAEDEGAESQPTPDLVPSGDMDSPQNVDEPLEDFVETIAPSAIFALQEDDVVFGLRRTAASDQLLDELPMYGSPLRVPKCDLTSPDYDPDAHWRRPALPLSKYVEGGMMLAPSCPPRRHSRYDAANEESPDDNDDEFVGDQLVHSVNLPPSTDEVSLFHPESKHIRDRLHAGHQFRPPSEYPMPPQSFYECRSPSQWTLAEDSELRLLVREYSYNWSLISTMLSTPSLFAAGAERRTPWECFERWIALEGLPTDMQRTQYFKAYNGRIEAAQRLIAQHNQLAMQQANASGGAVTAMRRRPNLPVRVERRRNQKHLTMLDAMRKLAKKRETAAQKQQHSASQSAAKKPSDPLPQRPAKTPRDYSLMRWERDQALAEKMAQYAQRQEAQRRAALQARAQAQGAPVAGAAGAGAPAQAANHLGVNGVNGVNGVSRPMSGQLAAAAAAAAASQGRTRMPMQASVNGVGVGAVPPQMNGGGLSAPPAQMNGAPQAQMPGMQGQHRMPMPNQQPDANLMLRAQRISEQQRAAVQIQQAQQQQQQQQQPQQPPQQQQPSQQPPPQQQQGNKPGTPGAASRHSSPPTRNGVNGVSQPSFMNNAQAMMASYTAAAANGNGLATPQANGLHMPSAASVSSPGQRMHSQLPPGITAQLNHLEASFRAKNPNLTPEQARQHATDHLMRAMMAQRQNAMHAAAGSGPPGIAGSIAATTSPHQYAALLRQQQQQQQQQQQLQQQHHLLLQQQQQQQGQQPKQPQPQQHQLHQQLHQPPHAAAVSQAASVASAGTPVAATASPAPSHAHQRAPSGSATPSAAGK